MKPHVVFLIFAVAGGLLLLALTPPFQVPDEPSHFYRAYAVSEGHFMPRFQRGSPGNMLPAAIYECVKGYLRLVRMEETHVSWSEIRQSRQVRINPDRRAFHHSPFIAKYPAVAFLPQASGIALARVFSDRPLDMMYAGRAVNLLIAVACIAVAIAVAPFMRWTLTLLALMPMTLFLRSSLSPDATSTALALLAFAIALRLLVRAAPADLARLTAISVVLSMIKPYGPVAFLSLASREVWASRRLRWWALVLIAATTAATIYLALYSLRFQVPWANADPVKQMAVVAGDPIRFVCLAADDYRRNLPAYASQFVGNLGWLNNPLPVWVVIAYLAMLVLTALFDGSPDAKFSVAQRLWSAVLAAVLALIVSLADYLHWTAVGAAGIEGVQGRYLIPIAPLLLVILSSRRMARSGLPGMLPWIVITTATCGLIASVVRIIDWYYV